VVNNNNSVILVVQYLYLKILTGITYSRGKKKFGDRPPERLTLPLDSEGRTKGREILRQEGKKATRHYSPGALSVPLRETKVRLRHHDGNVGSVGAHYRSFSPFRGLVPRKE